MTDHRLRQAQLELDEAGLLVPFLSHLLADVSDEDLGAAITGLAPGAKLRLLHPLLDSLGPEEWAVLAQLLQQAQGGEGA